MSIFERLLEPSNNPALDSLYREIVGAGFGRDGVPINWFTAQATRPDILAATWALVRGVLIEGKLPPTLKQMIALSLSVQNSCRYCEATHSGALQMMGVSDDVIKSSVADPEMAEIPPAFRAALQFALKAARQPNDLDEADYGALKGAGFSQGEILEIVMMAAFTQFINVWADAAKLPVDGDS